LGILILGMAFFGKIINDDANEAFDKVEQHFSLCNDYLNPVFNIYSCVIVDGVVKTTHGLKNQKEVFEEMKEKLPICKEKLKFYFENTPCHRKEAIENLKKECDKADAYLNKLVKNFEDGNGIHFSTDTLESGELYKNTDVILANINSLLDCHLETAKKQNDKCQKSLKSFKKICIVSSSVGLTIIIAVILKFFSQKNEIQKRNINNIGRKRVGRTKTTTSGKKTISNKK
jgi:hypothetical protein